MLRSLQPDARQVVTLDPGLNAFRFDLQPSRAEFEAHVELRLPQHQVIFSAVAATPEAPARQALEARRPDVAIPAQAKAA